MWSMRRSRSWSSSENPEIFFSAVIFTLPILTLLITNLKHDNEKRELLSKIIKFDETVRQNFKHELSYEMQNKKFLSYFIIFWLFSFAGGATYIVTTISYSLWLIHSSGPLFVIVINHIIHMNLYQVVIFMMAIQSRLSFLWNEIFCMRSTREFTQLLSKTFHQSLWNFTKN